MLNQINVSDFTTKFDKSIFKLSSLKQPNDGNEYIEVDREVVTAKELGGKIIDVSEPFLERTGPIYNLVKVTFIALRNLYHKYPTEIDILAGVVIGNKILPSVAPTFILPIFEFLTRSKKR